MKINLMEDSFTDEEINAINGCLRSREYTQGKIVDEFEKKFAAWNGSKYAVMVNSGSSANLLMVSLIKEKFNLKNGDEILVPTVTWPTTVYPIIQNNLIPVFCDVDESFNIDLSSIKKMKNERTRAIFAVHLLGQPARIQEIKSFCDENNLILIEDCCESLGAKHNETKIGNFGLMGSFSFYFGHHMTTIEGGMITTNNFEAYDLLKSIRAHGWIRESLRENNYPEFCDKNFVFDMVGYNVRSTNINAAIGLVQLKKIDESIKKRLENHKYFLEKIYNQNIIKIIPQKVNLNETSSFSLGILLENQSQRDLLLKKLKNYEIECRPIVAGNLLRQPVFNNMTIKSDPNIIMADRIHYSGLYLPNNQFMNQEKIDYMVNAIKEILEDKNDRDFFRDKKVLITGAGGFIGSYVSEILVERGAKVFANLRNEASNHYFLKDVKDRIKFVCGDLEEPQICRELVKGMDIVIHLAAKVGGVEFNSKNPAFLLKENLIPFMNIIEASRLENVERFLTVSSACVYRRDAPVPTKEEEGFIGLPEKTNEGYGMAKRMQEKLSMYYAEQYGMKIAIARPYNAYGPRDDFNPETSHVIPALIKRVLDNENPFVVWGSGNPTRAFLYAEDFAKGILEVCEKYPKADPINIGVNEEIKIKDIVQIILEITGKSPKIIYDTSKPEGQPRRNCDTSKAEQILNWKAKTPLREGLKKTIEWYKENKS